MSVRARRFDPMMTSAVIGSALIGAQYIAGKAARDAMFLAAFDASMLPRMIIGTSLFSITLVLASAWLLRRVQPAAWVPAAFAVSSLLLFAEWTVAGSGPGVAASLLYLQVSGLGPMLGSGFWLIASERFEPRSARRRFGIIAGAGTLGGLLGGLAAARIVSATSVETLLPLLAAMNVICAWQVWSIGRHPITAAPRAPKPDDGVTGAASGLRVLAGAPYLRNLALLVLLGTMAAVLVDYMFKVEVKAAFGRGPALGSFFSIYYAAISLLTFGVQTLASKAALEKLGLAACTSTPALSLAAGGALSLAVPGMPALVVARAGEAVSRGSLYRAGYELFYTPMAPDDKRAVKAVIDVGVDRSGDIIGASLVQALLLLPAARQPAAMIGVGIVCSLGALAVARRLTAGYVATLEQNLRNRAVDLDLAEVADGTTRTAMLHTLQLPDARSALLGRQRDGDREVAAIVALRSRDPVRAALVLRERELAPSMVSHVIPLLEVDEVTPDAIRALRAVAERHIGEFTDALLDPERPFAVRRRLARVLSACASQRAADGLLLALDDLRFEVRAQSARSLVAIRATRASLVVDRDRVFAVVHREVDVSRTVWEGRQLLDGAVDADDGTPGLRAVVNRRASHALTHVFTLLSLVLPADAVRIAYAGLQTTDKGLRGTALEYLDATLPPEIRNGLWPFLDASERPRTSRPRDEIVAELLKSNQSIMLNLDAIQKAAAAGGS